MIGLAQPELTPSKRQKTVLDLHYGNLYTGKTIYLYRNGPRVHFSIKPPFVGAVNYIIHIMVVTILVFILKIPLLVRGLLYIKIPPPTTNPHRLHGDVLSAECISSKRTGSRLNIKRYFHSNPNHVAWSILCNSKQINLYPGGTMLKLLHKSMLSPKSSQIPNVRSDDETCIRNE